MKIVVKGKAGKLKHLLPALNALDGVNSAKVSGEEIIVEVSSSAAVATATLVDGGFKSVTVKV